MYAEHFLNFVLYWVLTWVIFVHIPVGKKWLNYIFIISQLFLPDSNAIKRRTMETFAYDSCCSDFSSHVTSTRIFTRSYHNCLCSDLLRSQSLAKISFWTQKCFIKQRSNFGSSAIHIHFRALCYCSMSKFDSIFYFRGHVWEKTGAWTMTISLQCLLGSERIIQMASCGNLIHKCTHTS